MQTVIRFILFLTGILLLSGTNLAQDKAANQEALKQKGFKLTGDVVVANEEGDVDKAFRSLKTSYKNVMDAKATLAKAEQAAQQNRDAIKLLMQQRNTVSQQIDNGGNTTAVHNNLVLRYNRLGDEIKLRIDTDNKGEMISNATKAYSTPRNNFMKSVVSLTELIEKTKEKYAAAEKDSSLKALIESIGKTENKTVTLGPSKNHLQNVKDFARYEALVMVEDIKLEKRSNTYNIEVMLNGKEPIKMVFDTGASSISLSWDTALKAGLRPSDKDPDVRVTIANGRTVKGKLMKLSSVRVGKFELKNVECIVMPEELPDSPALLGGTFLNHFKYEVDAQSSRLRLSRVEGGTSTPSKSPGK